MGCNSDYLSPNKKEANSRETAILLMYAMKEIGVKVTVDIAHAATNVYGNASILNDLTVQLCNLCRSLNDEQKEKIIFNGRKKEARNLATWWEAHLKADEEREKREKKEKLKAEIVKKLDIYRDKLIDELPQEEKDLFK